MYGILHIWSVSVGLESQIWYLFIHKTGYLNVRKISETMDSRTFVGPLLFATYISMVFLRTLGFQLEDTVLLIGTFLLFDPVLFPKYEA